MFDSSCLAEGLVVPADLNETGINLNEIIVGPTGCGKSFSNVYSRLVNTEKSSVVVPIAKVAVRDKFSKMFADRGYKVINLDFAHPENSTIGYDPLDFVRRDEDVIQLAHNIIYSDTKQVMLDPYWFNAATSVHAAEIALIRLNAKESGKKPSYADVIKLHRSLRHEEENNNILKTNLDVLFEAAERKYPGNQATELWKTVKGLAKSTASCILSIVNSAIDKIFSESVLAMTQKDQKVSFKELGESKVAMFITTSPMNKTLQAYVNVLYADMFRELFECAENKPNYGLDIPVHIICDDFACGSKINDFEEYISIFRAARISVTLLLQSETQLISMYGDAAAATIIGNCDTYVYMGGNDMATCERISKWLNKPVDLVRSMPLEQVVVFRRGSEPFIGRRYQTLEDPKYKRVME